MIEDPKSTPQFPVYPSPGTMTTLPDPKQGKPLIKLISKMLKPQVARKMRMMDKPLKKKHKVVFY